MGQSMVSCRFSLKSTHWNDLSTLNFRQWILQHQAMLSFSWGTPCQPGCVLRKIQRTWSFDISWVINPTAETLGIDICDGIKRWNRCIWWYLFIFDLFNLPFLMFHVPISIAWDHWSPRSHAMLRGRAAPAMMPAGGGSSWRCMMDQVIALCMMQWFIYI